MSARCLHYVVGLDLGIGAHSTALAVIQQETARRGEDAAWLVEAQLRHLHRFPPGTSYPDIVDQVREVLAEVKNRAETPQGPDLIVDITGCGRAGIGLMRSHNLRPILVTITAGSGEQEPEHQDWRVAKTELVSNLQVMFQTDLLRMATSLPLTPVLIDELQNFKLHPPTITPGDPESWREGAQDDLVFATALAAWRVARHTPYPPESRDPYARRRRATSDSWMAA
jgi:hypothetical protein